MISIIIPIGREGADLYERIRSFVGTVKALAMQYGLSFEVFLVTDVFHVPTLKAMIRLAKEGVAQCLFLTKRIGKGGSIKNAVRYAKSDYVIILDADIPISPETVVRALLLTSKLKLDLLIANRVYREHNVLRRGLSIGYNTLVNILFNTKLKDHQAGFKILSKKATKIVLAEKTRTDGLAYDTEVIIWAKRFGLRYKTVNVAWKEKRQGSTIPPLRALLTMLADLIMLRLITIAEKHTALQKVPVGRVIDLKNLNILGQVYMTTIKASGPKRYLLNMLRKLYMAVAFKART